jgi:hypothetical protein
MKAKEFIIELKKESKPGNPIAVAHQKHGGSKSGAHKDQKKSSQEVRGQKHKKSSMESAPDGWEGTVKAMKKHKDIDNPYALAWSMKNKGYKSHKKEDTTMERNRDPEDWDEGNTEPGNNFAIYINGKKWKVFPGPAGAYADSPEEKRELYRLKAMAERKTQETGKKWEVYVTGEPATR